MPTQILRFEPRGTGRKPPVALVNHIDGKPRRVGSPFESPRCIHYQKTPGRALKKVRDALKARGKKTGRPVTWVEVFMAGPDAAWVPQKVSAWAKASMCWLEDIASKSVIHTACLHLPDGPSDPGPHIHALLSAVASGPDGSLVPGWPALRAQMAGKNPQAQPTRAEARRELSVIQGSYDLEVGQHFGLEWGETGSRRKSPSVKRAPVTARLRPDLKEALKSRAKAEGLPLGRFIELLLTKAFSPNVATLTFSPETHRELRSLGHAFRASFTDKDGLPVAMPEPGGGDEFLPPFRGEDGAGYGDVHVCSQDQYVSWGANRLILDFESLNEGNRFEEPGLIGALQCARERMEQEGREWNEMPASISSRPGPPPG